MSIALKYFFFIDIFVSLSTSHQTTESYKDRFSPYYYILNLGIMQLPVKINSNLRNAFLSMATADEALQAL